MTNFDFLKDFNNDLYQIGIKLETDTINSPRAVTADATLFLEMLISDIYEKSKRKLENNLISFYKKIDNLYRAGEISYVYKNKLRDAYNLRNRIHKNHDGMDESKLAFDLHKRLYYISKKYYRDYGEADIEIPEYRKPQNNDVRFDNCIICGCDNFNSKSNMCLDCNRKIDNVNILLSFKNFIKGDEFTKNDVIKFGMGEGETNLFLRDLLKENVISKKSDIYFINDDEFQKHFREVDQYIEIGLLLEKFYRDEISPAEIRSTLEYWKGGINQKNYREFYRLVNLRLEKSFEEKLLKYENIKKSMKESSMDALNVKEWFDRKKETFIEGDLNDAFTLFNELLIRQYFKLKKRNIDDVKIKSRLHIKDDIFDFWQRHFMSEDFFKLTNEIKKDLIIKEVKKNKTLRDILKSVGISQKEFERLYLVSKTSNDNFYKRFDRHYTFKRQKSLIRHLKNNNLNKAIRISKITKNEFYRWYYEGEGEYNDFYMKTTEILIDKYLDYRVRGWNKNEIVKHMNISRDMVKSWSNHRNLDLIRNFESENAKITSNLIKRGKIINALKEDKTKEEAIFISQLTQGEFMEIYNRSKSENGDFYLRFEEEYRENRKRLFPKLLKDNDFYNAIQKCDITQADFNKWYIKDQDRYLSSNEPSDFYLFTTRRLMDKYIMARNSGKNRPDAAKSVGLSNAIIDKWLRHVEFDLYWNFKKRIDEMELEFVKEGFGLGKSKTEVSEIYDIPLRTIDEYIKLANRGFVEYKKIKDLYEYKVIPDALQRFLNDFKNKTYRKALKSSKLTSQELDHYYKLGKAGSDKFRWFYESYMNLKISKYVDNILLRKSSRIALKNSGMTESEFEENAAEINEKILNERFEIIFATIDKHKSTGTKLANVAGVDVGEVYDWYFRGKNGDEFYRDFSAIFEIGVIVPRVMAFNHAKAMGIHKNWLHKKLKKELGDAEYEIWDKYGFINKREMNSISIDADVSVDEDRIRNILKNSEFIRCCFREDDPDIFEFMKNAVRGNSTFKGNPLHVSKSAVKEVSESEVMGK